MERDRLWKQAGDRMAEHLRREHGRGIYLEMQNAAWAFCCGLPTTIRCSECDFVIELDSRMGLKTTAAPQT